MAKKSNGRMINVDISLSSKIGALSAESLALFCLLIPHFNAHGKMLANPHLVKGLVCPLVEWLTPGKIEKCLGEISDKTSVKFWQDEKGLFYLQSLNWTDHQNLRDDRLGPDHLPTFNRDYSRSTPGVVPATPAKGKLREGKGKGKEEVEGKGTASPSFAEVVEYLNSKTGKRYKPSSEATKKLIRGRFGDGFTLDDFKAVIDNMAAAWSGDAKMEQYLRPETLFAASKFEGYLNTAPTQRKTKMQADMDDLDALLGGTDGQQGMDQRGGGGDAENSQVIPLKKHANGRYS